jgi:hypothetical protein
MMTDTNYSTAVARSLTTSNCGSDLIVETRSEVTYDLRVRNHIIIAVALGITSRL